MVVTTTACAAAGHPEFRLEADESAVPQSYLSDAADIVAGMVAAGSVFRPGQTVQLGWMITSVAAADGRPGRLTLHEPDGRAVPIRFVPGLTHTLRTMMLQLFVADSFGLRAELDLPTVLQSAVVCRRYADGAHLMATRGEPTDVNDSGWFFGCRAADHDHNDPTELARVSLYAAWLSQPAIQGWVGLPRGTLLATDGDDDGPAVFRGDRRLAIVPGSYLDRLRHGRAT